MDIQPGTHRHFAVLFFNDTWTLLDKPERSPEERETMIHGCHASLHHWLQVEGVTAANHAIGLWQLARVYAVAGEPQTALRWAERCLRMAEADGDAGLLTSAYEALARSHALLGHGVEREQAMARALQCLGRVTDPEDRAIYERDLSSVPSLP